VGKVVIFSELFKPGMKGILPGELNDVNALLDELSTNSRLYDDAEEVNKLLSGKIVVLATDRDEKRVVGMAFASEIASLSNGRRFYVDDVVVTQSYRGQGIAHKMMEQIELFARQWGIRAIVLTSRSSRIAAIRMYEEMGYVEHETNVFVKELTQEEKAS
jgi:GNAT superfamily N-acetyltransferase